ALAHEAGALFLLDGTQALGQIPVDVEAIGCDFFISNGHKWLFGPKGTGLLYIHPERLDELEPAYVGAGSLVEGGEMGELRPDAARFEFGTRPLHVWAGMNAALDWWETRGFAPLWGHMRQMAEQLRDALAERPGVTLLT